MERGLNTKEKLTDAELTQMLKLLKRFVETEVDQWAAWKFSTSFSEIYVDVSMIPSHPGTEEMYIDVNNCFDE